jgi:hypothetical protein
MAWTQDQVARVFLDMIQERSAPDAPSHADERPGSPGAAAPRPAAGPVEGRRS